MPKVFSIIVTYNGMQWIEKCISSIMQSSIQSDIIAIDNKSTDGIPDYIAEKHKRVHLIRSEKNPGFAKANNIGIRYAYDLGADYVFLLNQDAWVENETIASLIKTFTENGNDGIASPIHLNGSYSG